MKSAQWIWNTQWSLCGRKYPCSGVTLVVLGIDQSIPTLFCAKSCMLEYQRIHWNHLALFQIVPFDVVHRGFLVKLCQLVQFYDCYVSPVFLLALLYCKYYYCFWYHVFSWLCWHFAAFALQDNFLAMECLCELLIFQMYVQLVSTVSIQVADLTWRWRLACDWRSTAVFALYVNSTLPLRHCTLTLYNCHVRYNRSRQYYHLLAHLLWN